MATLPDGTVVMSGFRVGDAARAPAPGSAAFSTLGIHTGEVVDVLYPEDQQDGSGSECVYKVEVRYREGMQATRTLIWYCRLATPYEGPADFSRVTLRPATYSEEGKLLKGGSKVVVAAPNGDIAKAFIIGCVKQQKRKDRPRKKKQKVNREYEAEFNGVSFYIEDDGAFSIKVPGATDQDGKPDPERDENNKGTFVRFDKTGEVTLSDAAGESLRISPKEKLVEVLTNDWHVKAEGKVTVESKLAMVLQTEDSATFNGKKNIYIGNTGASENLVLGKKLVEALKELATILQTPVVSMSGNLGYPVPMNPEIISKVMAWQAKYLTGGPAPILSKNKFTER